MTAHPYSTVAEGWFARVRRYLCDAVDHRPRVYDGSYCFGYNYVCSRCHSFVGPWSPERLQAACDTINKAPPEEQGMLAARMSGGGPPVPSESQP